jgi:Leucine-rich repeat (LRR) protein
MTSLNLSYCDSVTDASIKKLTNLTHFDVESNDNITYKSFKYLINLTSMSLCQYNIEDNGLKKLTNLKSLRLKEGAYATGKSIRYLTRLEFLDLFRNTDVKTRDICKLTNLTKLILQFCTGIDEKEIIRKIPNIVIIKY